jgi:hypothetical protein
MTIEPHELFRGNKHRRGRRGGRMTLAGDQALRRTAQRDRAEQSQRGRDLHLRSAARGVATARGGRWAAMTVRNILRRARRTDAGASRCQCTAPRTKPSALVLTFGPTEPPLETTKGPRFPGRSQNQSRPLTGPLKMGSRRELTSVYCQCTAKE